MKHIYNFLHQVNLNYMDILQLITLFGALGMFLYGIYSQERIYTKRDLTQML